MSLLSLLQAKGIRVYESTPLWQKGEKIIDLTVGANCVVIPSDKYPGTNQIVYKEGNSTVYIQLKQGVEPTKPVYQIYQYAAVRNWVEYNISAGDIKAFAE